MGDAIGYHSKHWDWSSDFCHKHTRYHLPCSSCITTKDPDLVTDQAVTIADPALTSQHQIDPDYVAYQFGIKSGDIDELQQWI